MEYETMTIQVYTIQQLKKVNEKAYKYAFDKFVQSEHFHGPEIYDAECIIDFKEFHIISASFNKCRYSIGGYNSFFCFDYREIELDFETILKDKFTPKELRRLKRLASLAYVNTINELFYIEDASSYYRNTCKLAVDHNCRRWELSDYNHKLLSNTCEYLSEHLQDINNRVCNCLESDYEYSYSEENFVELCDCNEYRFDASGNIVA